MAENGCLAHMQEEIQRMSANNDDTVPNVIDHSVKRLFRSQPQAVLHLAGLENATVRFEDSNLNFPELRADHVFVIDQINEHGAKRTWALYLEYQLTPKPDLLKSWGIKWLALCEQLGMPVVLLAIYLERGDRATFPAAYSHAREWMETKFSFDVIRLWEYRDRILSGEWPELVPLLILCEGEPTEETLHRGNTSSRKHFIRKRN